MSVNRQIIKTSPEKVWDVLADGWLYPLWVVGATRMRAVDDEWPQVGSRIHHSAGVWPLVINDETAVLECEPGRMLRLQAKGWPLGEAEVLIELKPAGADTEVELREDAVAGPGKLMPEPAKGALLGWRNVETLRRLGFLAEGRAAR